MSAILLTPDMEDAQDRILCRVNIVEGCCWKWRGSANTSGYGLMKYQGKGQSAHRVSYKVFNGPIPDGLHILHACDHPWCVNPAHLRAGTAVENRADCKARGRLNVKRGSENGWSKLTEENVLEIRTAKVTAKMLAEKFGLNEGSVHNIRRGQTWKHVPGASARDGQKKGSASVRAKITEADVVEIRASEDTHTALSKKFGVSYSNIRMIRLGKSWKHVPATLNTGA